MAELSVQQKQAMAMAAARARAGQANAPLSDEDRSWIVPMSRNSATGGNEWSVPRALTEIPNVASAVYEGVSNAVTAPGRAMSGELQVMGPDGHVTEEAIGEGLNFAGAVSPMSPTLRAGEAIVPNATRALKPAKVEPPTAQALKDAAGEGYESLRSLDARYTSQSVADMANRLEVTLNKQGINDKTAPKTISTLRELQQPPEGGFASASDLETIRRTFNEIGQDFANPTDRNAGKFVRGAIDSFYSKPPDGAVISGSEEAAAQAGRTASNARANYAASKRSGQVSGLLDAAELRAAAANSGQNLGNSIRSRAASVLTSPKASSGFTENELAAIRKVAEGTTGQNLTRYVGNLLGGGGGMGAAVTGAIAGSGAAAMTNNPWMAMAGVAAPLTGAGSKQLSNIMTERAMKAVDAATRKRSPLYEEMQRNAGMVPDVPTIAPSFLRALLTGSQNQ